MNTCLFKNIVTLFVLCFAVTVNAKYYTSPSGKIVFKHSNGRELKFIYQGKLVLDVPKVGIKLASDNEDCIYKGLTEDGKFKTEYDMVAGKASHCKNVANKYTLHYELGSSRRNVRLVLLMFNDGIAFRYEMDNLNNENVKDEFTTYCIPEGQKRWIQEWEMGYERFFPLSTTGQADKRHWAYPALLQPQDDVFVLVTESNMEKYNSASSLKNEQESSMYKIALDDNDAKVFGEWHSPWRVAVIGDLATVVESTLVTDVAEPSTIDNTDWIKPGVASWVYWAYNRGSKDFQIVKKYIDLAYELKLPYVLIDWEWDVMSNGGDIDDALEYAKEKGVKVLLWYNSSTGWITDYNGPLYKLNKLEDREKEFAMLNEKGVVGVKIDFFAGDTQPTMQYCMEILESASKYHLLVNFHGATLPRGWQRTYPNLLSTEAVYGAEWYNNGPTLTDKAASHNCTLPFTRNVVGPMDYTPCAFSDSQHPHITTNAHELALTVVFESGITHLADRPESLLSQPKDVRDFFGYLPAAWDKTRLVEGKVGEYVVLARKAGNIWFVGILNGSDSQRDINIPQKKWKSILKKYGKNVLCFEDSGVPDSPWKIYSDNSLPQNINLLPRGGAVYVVRP